MKKKLTYKIVLLGLTLGFLNCGEDVKLAQVDNSESIKVITVQSGVK